MTTIAYHHGDGQIAVDSRMTHHGLAKSDQFDKTIKNKKGLWIFAGNASDMGLLSGLNHFDETKIIPECSAFLISGGKVYDVHVNEHKICEYFELTHSDTKGSGSDLALAAMDFGKSAREAVKYAATRDIYTGGRIRVYNVTS